MKTRLKRWLGIPRHEAKLMALRLQVARFDERMRELERQLLVLNPGVVASIESIDSAKREPKKVQARNWAELRSRIENS